MLLFFLATAYSLQLPSPRRAAPPPPPTSAPELRQAAEEAKIEWQRLDFAARAAEANRTTTAVDFGFISKSAGTYLENLGVLTNEIDGDAGPPGSLLTLAGANFRHELRSLITDVKAAITGPSEDDDLCVVNYEGEAAVECSQYREQLTELTLSNDAIWAREESRPQVEAPLVIKIPYYLLCYLLDTLFDGRAISRFFFLETVARMPYFSYISVLHLYESLGWWRRSAEAKRVHFAEEWNEFHHLLIMESLGGDQYWIDRFLAQHTAILYYWVLVGLFLVSPSIAYNFSELIEAHAVDTYAQFVDENETALRELPVPEVAMTYYGAPDLYLFDEFQTAREPGERRPVISSLYDVFSCIRDDEAEHVNTMRACQDTAVVVRSPNVERAWIGAATALVGVAAVGLGLYDAGMLGPAGDAIRSVASGDVDADTLSGSITDALSAGGVEEIVAAGAAAIGALGTALSTGEPVIPDEMIQKGAEELLGAEEIGTEVAEGAGIVAVFLGVLRALF